MWTSTARRAALFATFAGISFGHASSARAYTEPRTYAESPHKGGGGGRWFTGSPAEGYGCSVCHSGGAPEDVRIEGLPLDGYEPGERYEVRLSWPAFAARARKIRDTRDEPASAGLVAEFVAETGEGAGTFEVAAAEEARDGELCVLPEGVQAAQLYGVRPGEAATEEGIRCEATSLGQRCVVAMLACGADEVRIRWTAPAKAQGPIWFAAGFVATERASGDPERDAVTEIVRVVPPAGAAPDYEEALRSTCSVLDAPGRGGASARARAWLVLALLVGVVVRARARRVAVLACIASVAAGACVERDHKLSSRAASAHPNAGLFTPGSQIGADGSVRDAGPDATTGLSRSERNAIEESIVAAGKQDRCAALAGAPGTDATLGIEFGTATYAGFYEPKNVGVVWIEDAVGAYVATPLLWAELRVRNLYVWNARRCDADAPDAVSSATLVDHTSVHEARWDGRDHTGEVAPDGAYVLNIEVSEDEFNFGRRTEVPFEKGREPWVVDPDDTESVRALKLTYTPK